MNIRRTAFIIDGLAVGGAEKFFINVVNYFQRKGYQPLVIIMNKHNPLLPEMDKEIEYLIFERFGKYDLNVGRRIKSLLMKKEISQVFCVHTFSFFMTRIYFLFNRDIKFFLSVHSTKPKSFRYFAMNLLYFRIVKQKDTVIYICKAQKEYLKRKYLLRHKNEKLIYNGIDTSYFTTCEKDAGVRNALRSKYNILPEDKVIIKVARLAKEKGHRYAIEALKILRDKHNCHAYLFFVGSGDSGDIEKLRSLAQSYDLQSQIIFTNNQQDVRPFHCLADVFTLTSYSIETFSLAALEAMSSGRPCSLTNIGGAAEMINEATGALSVAKDPESIADSWYEILSKKYEAAILHNHVENNFSLPQMLNQYEALVY